MEDPESQVPGNQAEKSARKEPPEPTPANPAVESEPGRQQLSADVAGVSVFAVESAIDAVRDAVTGKAGTRQDPGVNLIKRFFFVTDVEV